MNKSKYSGLYKDAGSGEAYLGTEDSVDNSAKNMGSLKPGGNSGEEEYTNKEDEMGEYGQAYENAENDEEILDEEEQANHEEELEALENDINEALNAMFEGTNADPKFVEKVKTIFNAALNEKVAIIENAILQASQELIQEKVEEVTDVLTEHVDNYLTYVAEEWLNENRLQVEQGFRTEIAENFMAGLKELFENSFVNVPEDKYDVVDDLVAVNSELEDVVNKTLAENLELKNQLIAHECATTFLETSADLADTEVEKLQKLAEGIEFDSVEQYSEKLNLLKESYFGNKVNGNTTSTLNEETTTPNVRTSAPFANSEMDAYVSTISKLNKNTKKTEK